MMNVSQVVTTTTHVTVTVSDKEEEYHTASWIILWTGYLVASIACAIQVWVDRKKQLEVAAAADIEHGRGGNRRANSHQNSRASAPEGNETSGGYSTRCVFYRFLCFALISRTILFPVELLISSYYWQLIAETFPEMTFASAWTLLVSFFVQLVATAAGTAGGSNYTRPGMVIQMVAYGIYLILVFTDIWNNDASVLLYAILCCIYAALFGTLLYFGPRLVTMLQPSLVRRSGLAIRLIACCVICMLVFAATSVDLARQVVAPPNEREMWWKYGVLELFPSAALLIMMHPSRTQKKAPDGGPVVDATSRRGGGSAKRDESAPLVKPAVSYGTPNE